ncbi:MAG TPA: hypothetical protein PK413_05655 [Thermoanaerobaculia bacterium]|nr:hypothetical protein [Thermoanaerobaculia bacterium]
MLLLELGFLALLQAVLEGLLGLLLGGVLGDLEACLEGLLLLALGPFAALALLVAVAVTVSPAKALKLAVPPICARSLPS